MQWRNTRNRWGGISQLLHWLIALAVLALFALGWTMVAWPISPTKFELYSLHKSLGVTLLALVTLRLAWRLSGSVPDWPPNTPAWERRAALATHLLLYLLLIAMPVSGYLINSAANFPLVIWGVLELPNLTAEDERLQALAELAHLSMFWIMAALVLLHVAAALRHHWLLKDDVLRRMLPGHGKGAR